MLFLTFYFEPDLSAGSFRNTSLVEAIKGQMGEGDSVDVFTTIPNRYRSYRVEAPAFESRGQVTIQRILLPPHKSGMADQSRAFARYARWVSKSCRNSEYDIVFASSSRLFTAFLGAIIAKRQGIPLYLDIRDIFTEGIADVLSGIRAKSILPFLRWIERFTIRSARRVNLVSPGFLPHFQAIDPEDKYAFYTNGIDEQFVRAAEDTAESRNHEPSRKVILYAGNFGDGQGLHRIIPEAAQKCPDWTFRLIGDGGMRERLVESVRAAELRNVEIHPPVPREELRREYGHSDILFLHLNDYPTFRRVLPSKLFEYAATGKPVLAGVSGYAAEFLKGNVANAGVFEPCDVYGFQQALAGLEMGLTDRGEFVRRFRRVNIVRTMAADILGLAADRTVSREVRLSGDT